ncbi:MAG: class II SORL domain-containing protein [Candidatus Ranarchaeia archaeon]|jgi:superoxide reductase
MAKQHDCSHEDPNHALFCKTNKAGPDKDKLSDLQKKHLPVITAPSESKRDAPIEVTVEVGKLLKHPNEKAHHIQWIELWQREAFLTRIDLTPELTEPHVTITVKLDHPWPIIARARCNLHGIWEAEVPFAIKD